MSLEGFPELSADDDNEAGEDENPANSTMPPPSAGTITKTKTVATTTQIWFKIRQMLCTGWSLRKFDHFYFAFAVVSYSIFLIVMFASLPMWANDEVTTASLNQY